MVKQECQDLLVHKGQWDKQVPEGKLDNLVNKDQQVPQGLKVKREHKDQLGLKAPWVKLAKRVQSVKREKQDQ